MIFIVLSVVRHRRSKKSENIRPDDTYALAFEVCAKDCVGTRLSNMIWQVAKSSLQEVEQLRAIFDSNVNCDKNDKSVWSSEENCKLVIACFTRCIDASFNNNGLRVRWVFQGCCCCQKASKMAKPILINTLPRSYRVLGFEYCIGIFFSIWIKLLNFINIK